MPNIKISWERRLIGYGLIHLVVFAMVFVFSETFENTRLYPLLVLLLGVGPLLHAVELVLRTSGRSEKTDVDN
jgi:hypothetical protein